jgi:hypothetical protein
MRSLNLTSGLKKYNADIELLSGLSQMRLTFEVNGSLLYIFLMINQLVSLMDINY